MKFCFKSGFFIFYLIGGFCLISCNEDTEKIQANSRTERIEERPKEEEIKYFHIVGVYYLSINPLHLDRNLWNLYDLEDREDLEEPYRHWTKEDLKSYVYIDNFLEKAGFTSYYHFINLQSEPVDIRDLVDQSDFVKLKDGEVFFKLKENPKNYGTIREYYIIKNGISSLKYYCKEPISEALPEELILYDKLLVRLYDKDNQIISENKIRNKIPLFDNITDFKPYQLKISGFDFGVRADVMGMLELPPKSEREGLKYRLVRLRPDGQSSLYFDPEVEIPHQNYIREEPLPPYSEYKNWKYYEEIGCYLYANRLRDHVFNR